MAVKPSGHYELTTSQMMEMRSLYKLTGSVEKASYLLFKWIKDNKLKVVKND